MLAAAGAPAGRPRRIVPSPATATVDDPLPINPTRRRSVTRTVRPLGKLGSALTDWTSGKGRAASSSAAWLTSKVVIA